MNKLDSTEFELLAGTNTMEELIRNRVVLSTEGLSQDIQDCAEVLTTSMYYIRTISDYQSTFYFSSPIDRSRFIDYYEKNQNI